MVDCMIPILYDADLQDAWSVSNGIGRLSDTISCTVEEERNGAYTAKLVYPLNGIHAEEIRVHRIIKVLAGDKSGLQCFRIQSVIPTLDGKKITVSCNHVSYDLSYFPINPFDGSVISPATAFQILWHNEINQIPFVFDPEFYMLESAVAYGTDIPKSTRSMLMGSEGSILDIFGGEFEFDNRNIKWRRERGADNGVRITYGKNLTSFEQETNIAQTVCGILPYWKNEDDIVQGAIQYSANASAFPFQKVQVMDFTYYFGTEPENKPTVAQLEAKAASYVASKAVGYPEVSTKVEFYPVWQAAGYEDFKALERVGLCDIVTVFIPELDVALKAKVVKTVFNPLLERYESVTLGTVRKNIADTVAGIERGMAGSSGSGSSSSAVTGVKGNAESVYRIGDVNLTPANIGAVPTSRTVNNKALSADITLDATDVGAVDKTGDSMTGELGIGNDTYADRVKLRATDDGRGNIQIFRADGTRAANIYASTNGCEIDLMDGSATTRAALYINTTNGGILNLKDMQGNSTTMNRTQLSLLLSKFAVVETTLGDASGWTAYQAFPTGFTYANTVAVAVSVQMSSGWRTGEGLAATNGRTFAEINSNGVRVYNTVSGLFGLPVRVVLMRTE